MFTHSEGWNRKTNSTLAHPDIEAAKSWFQSLDGAHLVTVMIPLPWDTTRAWPLNLYESEELYIESHHYCRGLVQEKFEKSLAVQS